LVAIIDDRGELLCGTYPKNNVYEDLKRPRFTFIFLIYPSLAADI